MTFWTWEWLLQEVKKMQILSVKFRGSIYPGMPLPSVYARSVGCLEALLLSLIRRLTTHTYKILALRPGFRAKWDVQYSQRLQSVAISHPKRKDNIQDFIQIYSQDPLEFFLVSLTGTWLLLSSNADLVSFDKEYMCHEPSELFAMLDDYLSNAAKRDDIGRLDEVLYHSSSDFSALHQMLPMVRLHRPRMSVPPLEDAMKTGDGKAWRYSRAGYLDQDHRVKRPHNTENVDAKIEAQQGLGKCMREFLKTEKPNGARESQKWLDQDKAQRAACDQLWAQMHCRNRQTLERLKIGEDDIEADLKVLSADLAPEHIFAVQKERAELLAKIAAKESEKNPKKASPKAEIQTQCGSDDQAGQSISAAELKVKIKTRSDKSVEES